MALIKVKDSQGNWTVSPIIAKQDVYSTDEIEIGTWIDGKPLYRKVIVSNLYDTSINNDYTYGTSECRLVSVRGVALDGTSRVPIPFHSNNNYIRFAPSWAAGKIRVVKDMASYGGAQQIILIVEYTKTTD